ncbi:MAG TPA: tripartite tricarboxylate transporter substrate binding protein [Candidatus Sulfotelmatobacter sp.]|nr:tripartite tricarboxylate transporter substrate binding protein [Candidatus Sulfotelmatobacter sp.]
MTLPRRQFLRLAASAGALSALSRRARAETYPARSVRLVVGFAAAGVADITSRLTAQFLSERLGRQFAVENRTGAGGNIAAEIVAKAAPDGYTLLTVGVPVAVNPTLYGHLDFDYVRDFTPVAPISRVANVVVVNPAFPAKTFPEFVAYAKANPGKVTMATGGNGSTPHMFGELFKMMAGVNLVPVPYRGGGPALIDLLAGQVQVIFDPLPESIGYIRAGKLRPLAMTSATRSPVLPDVPTVGEFVAGYEATGWQGIAAPHGTPPEIVDILNRAVTAALADATFKARLADMGAEPFPGTPAAFAQFIADETAKWSKVVRAAGLTAG